MNAVMKPWKAMSIPTERSPCRIYHAPTNRTAIVSRFDVSVGSRHLTLLIEHPAPQTAPVLEEPFLGTCGLDALDVLQATNRGGIILTHALLCTPDHIQALAGIVVYDGEVDEGCRDADHRQYVIVRQHQYEVQHQQHHVDSLRCQHLDERMGDGLIESLPLLQVAHEAHGEEAHGQSQQVAKIVDVAS